MDCKYFDGCSAPLCPQDEGVEKRTWFPDEDICRLSDAPGWVKRQRKISRQAAKGEAQGRYFTLAMLTHDCRMCKGIKGIDPDGTQKERAANEAAWFKAHPVITAEERERNRELAVKNRGMGAGFVKEKTEPEQGLNGVPEKKGNCIPRAGKMKN